jgi:hypothetical protein
MFYVQTSTLPPRMHQKLTKHGKFCKQNNQLPTKTHVELKDNSISNGFLTDSAFYSACEDVWEEIIPGRVAMWTLVLKKSLKKRIEAYPASMSNNGILNVAEYILCFTNCGHFWEAN